MHAEKRSRQLLFLCSRPPFPLVGGDRIKNFNLLRGLQERYRVTLCCLTFKPVEAEALTQLKSVCDDLHIFQLSRIWSFINAFMFFCRGFPLQVGLYYHRGLARFVGQRAGEFDLVYATLVRSTEYVRGLPVHKIADLADSIALHYRDALASGQLGSRLLSMVYRIEYPRLLIYEKTVIRSFDRTFLFNQTEIDYFGSPPSLKWVPHGVNDRLFKYPLPSSSRSTQICFLGKMDYQPNIDAVAWFVEKVLPLLPRDIKFSIVGANPTPYVSKLPDKDSRIEVTGFVEDPYSVIQNALCFVAPMQTGGGIQNKVLEALAVGAVVVASPKAISAMPDVIDQRHLYICEQPEHYAEIIKSLKSNSTGTSAMRQFGRDYIQRQFTWQSCTAVITGNIDEVIHDC